MVHKSWEEKELLVDLFLDIKRAFDYILKLQLIIYIIELEINRNLTLWTIFFG